MQDKITISTVVNKGDKIKIKGTIVKITPLLNSEPKIFIPESQLVLDKSNVKYLIDSKYKRDKYLSKGLILEAVNLEKIEQASFIILNEKRKKKLKIKIDWLDHDFGIIKNKKLLITDIQFLNKAQAKILLYLYTESKRFFDMETLSKILNYSRDWLSKHINKLASIGMVRYKFEREEDNNRNIKKWTISNKGIAFLKDIEDKK